MGFFSKIISAVTNLFTGKEVIDDFTDYEDEYLDEDDYTEEYTYQDEIYLQRIRDVIEEIKNSFPNAGRWFERLVDEQVSTYGAEAVAEGLDSVSPKELETLIQIAFYAPEHPDGHSAMIKLWSMITSEIPSASDLKDMEDLLYM